MNEVIYRAMVREDIERALAGFSTQHWEKSRKILETYFDEQERGLRTVIIAEHNNEIAGYVTLLPTAKNGSFKKKNIPEIRDLIVFEKFQRQGIGEELMNQIEMAAVEISSEVCLGVGMHSGYGAAQRLYIKRGYVPDGSGVWCGRSPARQYEMVENGDNLVLYMSKKLR